MCATKSQENSKYHFLVHFWPSKDGFHKRMELFLDVLQTKGHVEKIRTFKSFLKCLSTGCFHKKGTDVFFYTSLMAPVLILLRLVGSRITVYYMVRGDEVTYVKHARRYFRAFVAFVFQKLMNFLNCHFIFASEDLRVLFDQRLGGVRRAYVLPNTIGRTLPPIRQFDGRVALVGDFGSVKNIEWAIESLSKGIFEVHLFGNKSMPDKWKRSWLHAHGVVTDLTAHLRSSCSLVVFPDTSSGFPNVLVEALEADCCVVVHRNFPFRYLPISDDWRFNLSASNGRLPRAQSQLEQVLSKLLCEQRDFKSDNLELVKLIESDWEKRVWDIFDPK